jgi:hypothetical protein
MASKFSGNVGYGIQTETVPGVWEDVITEFPYFGDVLRNTGRNQQGQQVNNNITVDNSISIVADAFANANYSNMRYIVWNGIKWAITSVQVLPPRLIISMGDVYDGNLPG